MRKDPLAFVAVIAGLAATVSLPWAVLAIWRFIRHGTPERSMKQIGTAVLDALKYEGSINSPSSDFPVHADHNRDGSVYCWIGGGTGRDQTIFLRALREVLRPVENPVICSQEQDSGDSSERTISRSLICSLGRRIVLRSLLETGAVTSGRFSSSIHARPTGGKSSFVPECTPSQPPSKAARSVLAVGNDRMNWDGGHRSVAITQDSRERRQRNSPDLVAKHL